MKKQRIEVIDLMQGLAMVLVVLGHHLLDFMPETYGRIHSYIYTFHMPLFIFISGFLISYSYKDYVHYLPYIKKRFIKFFVPYLLIGVVVAVLYHFVYGEPLLQNIVNLFISPKESSTTFLWYIYLLFFLYAIYPAIHRLLKSGIIYILILIALVLYIHPIRTPLFCIDYFTKYFIFYLIGGICAKYYSVFTLLRTKIICGIAGAGFFLASAFIFIGFGYKQAVWTIPFLSIPMMYVLSLLLLKCDVIKRLLATVSKECFHIYLLHMFVVQGIAVVFYKLHPASLTEAGMWGYLLLSSIVSMVIPVYVFKVINLVKGKSGNDISSNTSV